jgi:5'-methylthioadenosine phosphorylase
MAHVTDYASAYRRSRSPLRVVRTLQANTRLAQKAIAGVVEALPSGRACACGSALKDALITSRSHASPEARRKLALFLGRYLD